MRDVAKIVAKWQRIKHEQDTSLDSQGGQEPEGRSKRQGSGQLQGRDVEAASEVGGQPKKGKLSSKDGGNARTGKGLKGQTNKTSSQPKGVGSIKQSRRKTKGSSNLTKK